MKPATLALTILAALSLVLGGGSRALGKEGVEATLTSDVPLNAPPGKTISVAWRLTHAGDKGPHRPFNAEGVFVRLISASGGASHMGFAASGAHPDGHYTAIPPEVVEE